MGCTVNGKGESVYCTAGVPVAGDNVALVVANAPRTGVKVAVGVQVAVKVGLAVKVGEGSGVAVEGSGVKVTVGVALGRGDGMTRIGSKVGWGNGFSGERG